MENMRYYRLIEPFLAKKEVKAYTMLILSLLAMAFFGYFALKPTFITIASLKKQISDAKIVNKELQEKITSLSLAQDQYNLIKNDLPLIYEAMPKEPEFPSLLKSLEAAGTQSAITFTDLAFGEINLKKQPASSLSAKPNLVKFNLTVNGDYPLIDNFLNNVLGLKRLIIFNKMGFTKKESLGVVLSGEAFYMP